jgi:hypothetical protein
METGTIETQVEEIRHFESGAVRGSGGKFDFPEYVSPHLLFRYAEHMKKSAEKYGPGNWKKGIPAQEYWKSLCRHFFMLFAEKTTGIVLEPESDHLSSLIFNIQGLMHEEAEELLKKGDQTKAYGYPFIVDETKKM